MTLQALRLNYLSPRLSFYITILALAILLPRYQETAFYDVWLINWQLNRNVWLINKSLLANICGLLAKQLTKLLLITIIAYNNVDKSRTWITFYTLNCKFYHLIFLRRSLICGLSQNWQINYIANFVNFQKLVLKNFTMLKIYT